MNSFCICLRSSLSQKFKVEVDVYVSKKKKLVHMSFLKPLISYSFFEELIDFVESHWKKRKVFLSKVSFYLSKVKSKFQVSI